MKKTTTIPASVLDDWKKKILSVQIQMPGQDVGDSNQDGCGSTVVNAYYTPATNHLTVCAGDFVSGDERSTIGHELSHALGLGRQLLLFENGSSFVKSMISLRNEVCMESPLQSCPKDWVDLKTAFDPEVRKINGYQPPAADFLACFQYNPPDKAPTADFISDVSETAARAGIADLANRGYLLNLTKPTLLHADGTEEQNPDYLNPCGGKSVPSYLQGADDYLPMFYTLEYVCSSSTLALPDRMKAAADSALDLQKRIYEATTANGGKLAPDPDMIAAGYSEDTEEHFADAFGQRLFARILAKQYTTPEQKRAAYLANTAWTCDPPSNEKRYPHEAQMQQTYAQQSHANFKRRRDEMLVPEIRDALQCSKDTEVKDCVP